MVKSLTITVFICIVSGPLGMRMRNTIYHISKGP